MKQKGIFWVLGLILLSVSAIGGFFLAGRFAFSERTSSFKESFLPKEVSKIPYVPVMIVPHHLMAKQAIEETFSEVQEKNKETPIHRVILISPNHFNRGDGWAVSSKREWRAGGMIVHADEAFIDSLGDDVFVRDAVLDLEHGIYNMVPFVAHYFPEAKIVPLALRDGMPESKINTLFDQLKRDMTGTLIILSADFSHYLDKNLSSFHDQKALRAIYNFEYENVPALDIDCASGLMLVLRYTDHLGVKNFHFVQRSSSSTITGINMVGQETSHIAGYFSQEAMSEQKKEQSLFLLFAGDAMFDRDVRKVAEKHGVKWMTEDIKRIFLAQDVNVLNLEGSVTKNASVSLGAKIGNPNHYRFTFDPDSTSVFLASNYFNVVNLGNNHSTNSGVSGVEETKIFLQKNTISFFGDPLDEKGMAYTTTFRGKKVTFVNYNAFGSFGWEKTVDKIQKEHTLGNTIIVYCHWGIEYALRENEDQQMKAHAFIDAGADAVIGSHPHVVEPIEIYKGKAIFYSLGNFVFDQYFSKDTQEGLLVGVELSTHGTHYILIPIRTEKNGKIDLLTEKDRQEMLDRIAHDTQAEEKIRINIRDGAFSL